MLKNRRVREVRFNWVATKTLCCFLLAEDVIRILVYLAKSALMRLVIYTCSKTMTTSTNEMHTETRNEKHFDAFQFTIPTIHAIKCAYGIRQKWNEMDSQCFVVPLVLIKTESHLAQVYPLQDSQCTKHGTNAIRNCQDYLNFGTLRQMRRNTIGTTDVGQLN